MLIFTSTSIMCAFLSYANTTPPTFFQLDSIIIKSMDGNSVGFNGTRIYKIKKLGKNLTELYYEITTVMKELISYGFDLNGNSEEVLQKLSFFTDKLHETTLPFMSDMDGFRSIVLTLIKDSCEKRNRMNSFLLTWGKCPEGKEYESIKTNLKTFKDLQTFVGHLIHFLGDLIHSCPKGYAQYLELIKKDPTS